MLNEKKEYDTYISPILKEKEDELFADCLPFRSIHLKDGFAGIRRPLVILARERLFKGKGDEMYDQEGKLTKEKYDAVKERLEIWCGFSKKNKNNWNKNVYGWFPDYFLYGQLYEMYSARNGTLKKEHIRQISRTVSKEIRKINKKVSGNTDQSPDQEPLVEWGMIATAFSRIDSFSNMRSLFENISKELKGIEGTKEDKEIYETAAKLIYPVNDRDKSLLSWYRKEQREKKYWSNAPYSFNNPVMRDTTQRKYDTGAPINDLNIITYDAIIAEALDQGPLRTRQYLRVSKDVWNSLVIKKYIKKEDKDIFIEYNELEKEDEKKAIGPLKDALLKVVAAWLLARERLEDPQEGMYDSEAYYRIVQVDIINWMTKDQLGDDIIKEAIKGNKYFWKTADVPIIKKKVFSTKTNKNSVTKISINEEWLKEYGITLQSTKTAPDNYDVFMDDRPGALTYANKKR